ncbi:coiled-coil domain-containing protein 157-like [Varanus komodoensis]|uniref:coiled-coil domain-containing protein 157-like n=1 Tax=Varanus komodoensis TaxID=61221 RepID=UPI001CF7C63A|nr:coiled-coil domain-containing protein 157-like [Varanus komodoensis]
MSLGLAVRKFWSSMLKVGILHQQLVAEKKHNKEDASSLGGSFQAAKAETEHLKSCSSGLSTSEHSELGVSLPSVQASPLTLSASSRLPYSNLSEAKSVCRGSNQSIHAQAIESSLMPCDACKEAQASLREVGNAIITVCSSQNLPSSLSRFLEMVEQSLGHKPLTAMDLSYWASEQSKDLSRINKHLWTLVELINPLKEELECSNKQKEELKGQLETFHSHLQKERELLLGAVSLEKEVSTLKERLRLQEATIQELEQAKSDLLEEMKVKMVDRSEMARLNDQVEVLASQLESAKQQLNWALAERDKEKARVESMLRHKESLQAKQRGLMQQLDLLDQECEQLRSSLAEEEEKQYIMKEHLEKVQGEQRDIHIQLEAQQTLTERMRQEKLSLEQSTSDLQRTISELGELVQEMKERERLLVSFPDLHIPVEAQFRGTGDILEDMGKQLQANNIRISILEEENSRLRTAVAKMKETAQQEAPKLVLPTQLWMPATAKSGNEEQGMHHSAGHSVGTSFPGTVPRPSTNSSKGSATHNRAQSGHSTGGHSSASRRAPSSQQPKSPSRGAAQKVAFTFACEDTATNLYIRTKGRDMALGHPTHCTRNHQK